MQVLETGLTGNNITEKKTSVDLGVSTQDFLKLLTAGLRYQDPQNAISNEELMGQMAALGTLSSTANLQSTVEALAGNLSQFSAVGYMGKFIEGLTSDGVPVEGNVVKVIFSGEDGIEMELDSGESVPINGLTSVSEPQEQEGEE